MRFKERYHLMLGKREMECMKMYSEIKGLSVSAVVQLAIEYFLHERGGYEVILMEGSRIVRIMIDQKGDNT